jgi:hypothetical protein
MHVRLSVSRRAGLEVGVYLSGAAQNANPREEAANCDE